MSESNGKKRPVVCLGMPGYGEITSGAGRAFYRASEGVRFQVKLQCQESSLLALNFNTLWCWALNDRADYFAMLHSDVEPEDFWLDKLIDELEAQKLDYLGVVVPIKDTRGVTSIALESDDGDTFRPHCRLTMREVYRLPETFTSADVGRPVLPNTGCWVAKLGAWSPRCFFTINDEIVLDDATGKYVPRVEPEDWFFGRLMHEQGLKVGITRKIQLGHRGHMTFGNTRGWGDNDFDQEYLKESSLPERDWFPADVPGWLTETEGRELARLADGKVVLEVGSFCGRSTVCLAQKAKSVAAVDTFDGRGTAVPGATERAFKENIRRFNVDGRVNVFRGESEKVIPRMPQIFDLAFIDGSHDYESVRRDAELAAAVLKPGGGLLVFHDFGSPADPGVSRAVDELLVGGAELVSTVGTLAVVRPAAHSEVLSHA